MDFLDNSGDNSLAVLYTLSDDPERKDFLDELFEFMVERRTPIMRVPIMGRQHLDLYELYRLVVDRGGLLKVIQQKQWREIRDALRLPSTMTSAAYTLRTQYWRHLYAYECHKHDLSKPEEVEEAIERNQREVTPANDNGGPDLMPPYPVHPGFPVQHPGRFLHPAFYNPGGYFPPYGPFLPFGSHPFMGAGGAAGGPMLYGGYSMMPPPRLPDHFPAKMGDTAGPSTSGGKRASSAVSSTDDVVLNFTRDKDTAHNSAASSSSASQGARNAHTGDSRTSVNRAVRDDDAAAAAANDSVAEDRDTTENRDTAVDDADRDASVGSVTPAGPDTSVDNATPAGDGTSADAVLPVDLSIIANDNDTPADNCPPDNETAKPSADRKDTSSRNDDTNGTSKDNLPGTSSASANNAGNNGDGAPFREDSRKRPRREMSPIHTANTTRRQVFSFDMMGWEAAEDDETLVLRLRINGVRYRGLVNLEVDDDDSNNDDNDGLN